MSEVGVDCFADVSEDVAGLLSTCFDDGQHRLHEAAATGTLRAEGKLSPNDRVTQGPFAGIVRRLHAIHFQKRPQPGAMLPQFLAHADQMWIAAVCAAQQGRHRDTARAEAPGQHSIRTEFERIPRESR